MLAPALHQQIESSLPSKFWVSFALKQRPVSARMPSGIPQIEIPRGTLSEIYGPPSSDKTSKEPIEPLHPLLAPILERTLGVPLFQEQLLRMAMPAANFTGGQAEDLRRAMGFKRSQERMREIERRLRSGMAENGITGAVQDTIVQSITSFALYGFPESHAASFALLAYASAWLKHRHLAAFTCALLNNQPMGFYHPAILVKDAQRHGLRVLHTASV